MSSAPRADRSAGSRADVQARGWFAAGLAVLVMALAPLAPAAAHAELTSSSPQADEVVQALPSAVELTFSGAIATPAYVVVTDPSGREVGGGRPEVVAALVTQPVAGAAAAGAYTVEYRVVSVDGHSVAGTFGFTVGTQESASVAGPEIPADGFWESHWRQAALAGVGLLAGFALLGTGLRGRR